MFHRDGLCEYCKEERFVTITVDDNGVNKEICFFCLESELEQEYNKGE